MKIMANLVVTETLTSPTASEQEAEGVSSLPVKLIHLGSSVILVH